MFLKVSEKYLKDNFIEPKMTYYIGSRNKMFKRGDRFTTPNVIHNQDNIYIHLGSLTKLGFLFYGG